MLRLHLAGLRLPEGPAQDLRLRLEGAIALPRKPELKLDPGVGLVQEDLGGGHRELPQSRVPPPPPPLTAPASPLGPSIPVSPRPPPSRRPRPHLQEQVLGGGPRRVQRLLRPRGAGVDHAGACSFVGARRAHCPVAIEHIAPIATHQRCKGRVSRTPRTGPPPSWTRVPSPASVSLDVNGKNHRQQGASSLRPYGTQVVPAPLHHADVSGARGDQGHVPVPGKVTWAGG